MRRLFFYTDVNGIRQAGIQNAATNDRLEANRLLGMVVHANSYKDVEVLPAGLPDHELKSKINALAKSKGNPEPYPAEETQPPEPGTSRQEIIITDHAEGTPQDQRLRGMVNSGAQPISAPSVPIVKAMAPGASPDTATVQKPLPNPVAHATVGRQLVDTPAPATVAKPPAPAPAAPVPAPAK